MTERAERETRQGTGAGVGTQPIVWRTKRGAFVWRKPPRCAKCSAGWLYVEPLALEDGDHEVVCVNCGQRQYLSRLIASEVAKLEMRDGGDDGQGG